MESIIETLYINLLRPQAADSPEYEKTYAEFSKMCDLIQEQYGLDFLDRLTALHGQLKCRSGEREFFLGFHAGVRLMLEVLET